jgi:competence protein ComEA
VNNFPELLDRLKIPIGLLLVGLILIIVGLFIAESKNSPEEFPKESIVQEIKTITIDIAGAVNKAGVYKLNSNSRIEDAILAAGGLNSDANIEYISKYINMAQKTTDGMKIYIPFIGEQPAAIVGGAMVAGATNQQININSATASELESLPGIGEVTAAKIIGSRPYQKIEDLLEQKIVNKSTFEKIKASIVVY